MGIDRKRKQIRRGDIFYVSNENASGSEQRYDRPGIIVSNDYCNTYSDVIEVVYLTTQKKKPLPTHVTILSTGRRSTALCEQIFSVSVDRLKDFTCHVTLDEMLLIDRALATSVGIAACGGKKDADRGYPSEERMLALVCLRYLQNVMGPRFTFDADRDRSSDGKQKVRRREHERTP